MKIISVPNPKLRQVSQEVEKFDQKLALFVHALAQTLISKTNPTGVGISAIQVGKPLRVFLTYLPLNIAKDHQFKHPRLQIFINPIIIDASDQLTLGDDPKKPLVEGCLSIPGLYGPVYRHESIVVKFLTYNHNNEIQEKTEKIIGFTARVIQHEYDHLEGVLFTDRNQKDNLPLYFEKGDNLEEIHDPKVLINW